MSVKWHKKDRYGRLVGKVTVAQVDVALEQVRLGMAWHYKAYEGEQSASDRVAYATAEAVARAARIGLWSQLDAVPPWDFRRLVLRATPTTAP